MPIDDAKIEDELDFGFGSLERHDGPYQQGAQLQDRVLGDNDIITQSPEQILARGKNVQPPPPHTVNQATMECLRGPCVHLWSLTARFHSQAERLNISRVRQCNCHYEPTDLTEQNIYHCDQWWPTWLLWVPESARPMLRPQLRHAWEWILKKRGYDFSWKFWKDAVFETDEKDQRGKAGVGIGPATFFKPKSNGGATKTKDGLFFNT